MATQPISNLVVHRVVLLSFEEVFPNETPLPPEEYIRNASRTLLLNAATHFLGFKSFNSRLANAEEAILEIFSSDNSEFASMIYRKILELQSNIGTQIIIFNSYSSLKLFQLAFEYSSDSGNLRDVEVEQNLFKAYLIINSKLIAGENNVMRSLEGIDKKLKLTMIDFCQSFIHWDIIHTDLAELTMAQMIKSILLFRFLESNITTNRLLQLFLEFHECENWREYLKRLYPIAFHATRLDSNGGSIDLSISHTESFESTCRFIDKLIIPPDSTFAEYDFNVLRSSPLYKVSDGLYRFIFCQFVIEKLHKGVYFGLKRINETNGTIVPDLKALIGEYFSERVLLYDILIWIYGDKYIKFSGEEIKSLGYDAEPDYFLRIGKNIFLFESKDFLIRAAVKESRDFQVYEAEFKKFLYYDQRGNVKKPKAILQLINNIKRVLTSQFEFDKSYKYKEIVIYPIIITHDNQYNVRGLNHLINYWFESEKKNLADEGYFTLRVQPIVMIDIDSLLIAQNAFKSGKIKLNEILDVYINFTKIDHNLIHGSEQEVRLYYNNKNISFSDFIFNYTVQHNLKSVPEMLNILGHSLFE